ncbi:MAG TPA: hypothetical protein VI011_04085 [Asanoa sp.]
MLDSGGGGRGYAGTNWNAHDTPDMWRQLQNQDTDPYWTHVSGLRKITELTSTHLSRVQEYRDSLAAAWPPETNTASAAFISRLDYLVAHMQQTHDTAVANYTTVSTTAAALMTARQDLKAVYDDYVKMVQQKKDYDDAVAFQLASNLPGTSLGDPPVTANDIELVNNKARVIMFDLSATLTEAQSSLQRPTPYKPQKFVDDGGPSGGGGSGGAPALPPVVALPPPAPSASSRAPSLVAPVPMPTASGIGPVLGGAAPAPTAPRPNTGLIVPPAPVPAPAGPWTIPTMPGLIPSAGPLPGATTAPVAPGGPGGIGRPTVTAPVAGGPFRAMPPGGPIGVPPSAGLAQPAAGRPIRRVNPVGGVIGTEPALGRTGSGIMPGTGQPGRSSGLSPTAVPGGSAGRPHTTAGEPTRIGGRANPLAAETGERSAPGQLGSYPGREVPGRRTTVPRAAGGRLVGTFSAAELPPGVVQVKRADGSLITPHQQRPVQPEADEHQGGRRWNPDNPWETANGVTPVLRPSEHHGRADPGPAIGLDR